MSDGSNDDFDALSQEIKTLRAERDFALAKNHAPCLDSEALLRAEIRHLQANLQAECDEHDRVRAENAELRAQVELLTDAIGPDHAANTLSERR